VLHTVHWHSFSDTKSCMPLKRYPFRLPLLVLLISSAPSFAASGLPQMPTMSTQQADNVVAAFKSGENDQVQLSSLPLIKGTDLVHLTAITGIHRITPSDDEDYFAFNAKVGNKRFSFYFTVTPRLASGAHPPSLATLLENGRVTQYDVTSFVEGKENSHLVACHSRDTGLGCKPFSWDSDSSKIRQPARRN